MTKIQVETSTCLTFKVPVTVNGFSLIAVMQTWSYIENGEFKFDELDSVDYEDLPKQCLNENGAYDYKKMENFRNSYKTLFNTEFDKDVEDEVEKILTKDIVNSVKEKNVSTDLINEIIIM